MTAARQRVLVIDAVIVTWNSRERSMRCVARTLQDPAVDRVILVDNASSDGTASAVEAQHPEVDVVIRPEDTGLAAALNHGAARGANPFVLFLNDDVFAEDGSISRLLAALDENAEAPAAAGRLVNEDGTTQHRYQPRTFPTAIALSLRLMGIDRWWPRNPFTGMHLRRPPNESVVGEVDQPAGACLLIRRSVVEAVGGWDERYWFWYEDVDLLRRLTQRAGSAIYVPSAPFAHLGGATAERLPRPQQHRRAYYGMLLYAQTHFGRGGQLLVCGSMALACGVRLAKARLRADRTAAKAYSACLASVRTLAAGGRVEDTRRVGSTTLERERAAATRN